jgi:hypothetical protein
MQISFSQAMLKSIESHIQEARGRGAILDVYRIAEIIRVKHIDDNVALEDIVEKIVLNAGSNLPVEFNLPDFATEVLEGVVDGSPIEALTLNANTIH